MRSASSCGKSSRARGSVPAGAIEPSAGLRRRPPGLAATMLLVAAGLALLTAALLAPAAFGRPAPTAAGPASVAKPAPAVHPASVARASSSTASSPIAFVRGDHIWTIAPDGSGAQRLTSGAYGDGAPAWSPDHGSVYFYRSKSLGEDAALCSVPASGGSPTVIYQDAVPHADFLEITGVAADPAGGRVVFADVSITSTANLPVCRVVAVDLKTGTPTVLLQRAGGFGHSLVVAWHVTWSPDGTRLLVSQSGQDAEGGQTGIFTLADQSVRKLGVPNAANADWSADGASVLVSIDGQLHTSVRLVRDNGTVIRTLAAGGGWQGAPAVYGARFSGDGAQIAYTRGIEAVWLMSANGSGKHKLTKGSEPAWR